MDKDRLNDQVLEQVAGGLSLSSQEESVLFLHRLQKSRQGPFLS